MEKLGYLAFAFALLGAGCFSPNIEITTDEMMDEEVMDDMHDDEMMGDDMMDEEDEDEVIDEEEADEEDDNENVISMDAGNFFYEPASVTVKAGQEVTIEFDDVSGFHDFVIDEIDLKVQLKAGESVTFTAPTTPGTYTF